MASSGFLGRWFRKMEAEKLATDRATPSPLSSPEKDSGVISARRFYGKRRFYCPPDRRSSSSSSSSPASSQEAGSSKISKGSGSKSVLHIRTNLPSPPEEGRRGRRHASAPGGRGCKPVKSTSPKAGQKRSLSRKSPKEFNNASPPENMAEGNKFFKHRSPALSPQTCGSIVVRKGFKLTFLPRRDLSKTPKRKRGRSRSQSVGSKSVGSKRRKVQEESPTFDFEDEENEEDLADGDREAYRVRSGSQKLNESMIAQVGSPMPPNKKVGSEIGTPTAKMTRTERAKCREERRDTAFAKSELSPAVMLENLSTPPSSSDSSPEPQKNKRSLLRLQKTGKATPSRTDAPKSVSFKTDEADRLEAKADSDTKGSDRTESQTSKDCEDSFADSMSVDSFFASPDLPTPTVMTALKESQKLMKQSELSMSLSSLDSGNQSPSLFSEVSSVDKGRDEGGSPTPASSEQTESSPDSVLVSSAPPGKGYFPLFTPGYKDKTKRQTSTKSLPAAQRKLAKRAVSGASQMILDAGQKKFGATQCKVCGMVYSHADPTDEDMHSKFHFSLVTALKFPGWKKERVVEEFPDDGSRIIVVMHGDPKSAHNKVEQVNAVVGQELGLIDSSIIITPTSKVYLHISDDKLVDGYCVAESITKAHRVIPNKPGTEERPWCCSTHSERALAGVSRLWVYGPCRGRHIATRLVDCVREAFEYGVVIEKSELAFSDPTIDGKKFATNYCGREDFLVYRFS